MEAKGAKGAFESPTSIDMRAVIVETITVLLPVASRDFCCAR